MSLVDYAASSDEEEEYGEERREPEVPDENTFVLEEKRRRLEATTDSFPIPKLDPPLPQTLPQTETLGSAVNGQAAKISEESEPPALELPDASLLLNSSAMPSYPAYATDHSYRIAAMAESESRKRDLNGTSSSSYPRSKVPRGNLPHSKSFPDTVSDRLLPPQLAGRSNIVTEDISKLFVKSRVNSSSG